MSLTGKGNENNGRPLAQQTLNTQGSALAPCGNSVPHLG